MLLYLGPKYKRLSAYSSILTIFYYSSWHIVLLETRILEIFLCNRMLKRIMEINWSYHYCICLNKGQFCSTLSLSYLSGTANGEVNSFWNQMPIVSLTWLNICSCLIWIYFLFMFTWTYMCCIRRLSEYGEKNLGSSRILWNCVLVITAWYLLFWIAVRISVIIISLPHFVCAAIE